MSAETAPSDEQLVLACLGGNRDAFSLIVSRYQNLIASLAYSATGCLGLSENLAQETFITAWRHLRQLREPARLRSWLCGIARHLARNRLRRSRADRHLVDLDTVTEVATEEPSPVEQAISREEESLLWRSLERLPVTYREPMVLFYREQQSVGKVAEALELSEDAVKQRLARGRRMLNEQMVALVEGTLAKSAPGRAFTLGVMAALPLLATSAGAATAGAVSAKGSVAVKTATVVTLFNVLFGPLVALLGGYVAWKASLESTRTPRERQFVVGQIRDVLLMVGLFATAVVAYFMAAIRHWQTYPEAFAVVGVLLVAGYVGLILSKSLAYNRTFRRIRQEEQQRHPELFPETSDRAQARPREYRTRLCFLGLPLVHIRFGDIAEDQVRPAMGWIAIGDRAYGVLFAAGTVAVGTVSLGGAAVGLLSFGGLAIGALAAVGGMAMGGFAVGGAAIGWMAAGGVALAWAGAVGGMALAREVAVAGMGVAAHFNDPAAYEFLAAHPWFDIRNPLTRTVFVTVCWMPLLLFSCIALIRRHRARLPRGET